MSLFPIRTEVESDGDAEPRLVRLDSEDAGAVLDAIGPATARRLLATVSEEPGTKSDLADRVDTSLQNASYHLDNLADAGLVTVVDTWYSSRGREMPVFGPATGPVVVYAGDEEPSPDLRRALATAVGGLGVVGLLSLAVQWVYERWVLGGGPATWSAGDGAAVRTEAADAGAAEATNATLGYAAETTTAAGGGGPADGLVGWLAGLPPGGLFFSGGVLVVLLWLGWWVRRVR